MTRQATGGRIAALKVYPVKGCGAVAVEQATLRPLGLHEDRRWMIVEAATGRFLTQRNLAILATIRPQLRSDELLLELPNGPVLTLAVTDRGDPRRVMVWRDEVDAIEPDKAASDALSKWLGRPVALVRFPETAERPCDLDHAPAGSRVAFADGFPLLVTSTGSLDALNARIAERGADPVPMQRFRPNIVIEGVDSGAEDRARSLVIEDGPRIDLVKRCTRCAVTTVDQATGVKTGKEPIRTLAVIRADKPSGGVWFGQNAVPRLAPGDEAGLQVGQRCLLEP